MDFWFFSFGKKIILNSSAEGLFLIYGQNLNL